jgi:hypothetical protein
VGGGRPPKILLKHSLKKKKATLITQVEIFKEKGNIFFNQTLSSHFPF